MHAARFRGGGAPPPDDGPWGDVPDHEASLLRDVVPAGWFCADMADVGPGSSVAVFGCGAVGLFAIVAARMRGASQIFAVDRVPARLERARTQGAVVVDFEQADPVATILELTCGRGVERVIDTAAEHPEPPADDPSWHPGRAPDQVLQWSVEVAAPAGTIAILGVDAPTMGRFPIGAAMVKQLKIAMGSCDHRKYVPELVALVRTGALRPSEVLARPGPTR